MVPLSAPASIAPLRKPTFLMNSTLNEIRSLVCEAPSAVPAHWMRTKNVSPLGAVVVTLDSRTKPPASRLNSCEQKYN